MASPGNQHCAANCVGTFVLYRCIYRRTPQNRGLDFGLFSPKPVRVWTDGEQRTFYFLVFLFLHFFSCRFRAVD